MGLDDRDYMRERYRARGESTRWNDRAGRVEGVWFDPAIRGFDYQRGRWRRPSRSSLVRYLPFALSLVLILIPFYGEARRAGWLPDREAPMPFPESGSVTVARWVMREPITSFLTVEAAGSNAVVQLIDPGSGRHAISVYVSKNDRIRVAVPQGTFRIRLIEGQKWHGPARYFGSNTSYETATELMIFTPRTGHIIDLHRRPDGNLKTRMMLSRPERL
jgi:hypothetical protein